VIVFKRIKVYNIFKKYFTFASRRDTLFISKGEMVLPTILERN